MFLSGLDGFNPSAACKVEKVRNATRINEDVGFMGIVVGVEERRRGP